MLLDCTIVFGCESFCEDSVDDENIEGGWLSCGDNSKGFKFNSRRRTLTKLRRDGGRFFRLGNLVKDKKQIEIHMNEIVCNCQYCIHLKK